MLKHKGKFYITEDMMKHSQQMWQHIIPLRVEFLYITGCFECFGISHMFEECSEATTVPLYKIVASREVDNNGEEYIDFYAERITEPGRNNGLDILG
jgi:hypothetical protein